jgi:general secretion pathway protein B
MNPASGAPVPGAPPAVGSIPSPRLSSTPLTVPGAQTMAPQPGTPPPPPPPVPVVVPQPPVAGLPGDAPKLAVSGGVYSSNPAQRMLIVNGQVFNEGSEVAPGVVLDEIKSKTAVLRFRGARYTVTF